MKACQQDLLYTAERVVDPGEVMSLPRAQAWLDDLVQCEWFGDIYPMISFVEVFKLPASAPRSVGAFIPRDRFLEQDVGFAQLEMLPQHLTPLMLCHELAHACAAARYDSRSHDPWFARTYLELVARSVGSEMYRCLQAAFEDHGVDFDADTSSGRAIAL